MILIVVTSMILVGTFVTNLLNERIESSQNCLDTMDNIIIGNEQTCYNATAKELKIFMEIKDIEIDEVLVSISDGEQANTISITSQEQTLDYIKNRLRTDPIILPSKKSGLAYYVNVSLLGLSTPREIKLVPVIDKKSCEVVDQITSIPSC